MYNTQINHYYGNKYELRPRFLEALKETGIIGPACKKAGISRTTFYRWYYEGGDFLNDCVEAVDVAFQTKKDLLSNVPTQKKSQLLQTVIDINSYED